jgi:hypothetical protein
MYSAQGITSGNATVVLKHTTLTALFGRETFHGKIHSFFQG